MQATIFCTDTVSIRERSKHWQDINTHYFGSLKTESLTEAPLDAHMQVYGLGRLNLFLLDAPAHRVAKERSRYSARPATAADDYYKLVLQLGGRAQIEQAAQTHHLLPGNWSLYDPQKSYSITNWEACRLLVLQIPRGDLKGFKALELHTDEASDPNLRGLSSVFGSLMGSLAEQIHSLPDSAGSTMADTLLGLLGTTLQAKERVHGSKADSPAIMRSRIKQYIQAHLCEADLTPARIAQDLHCSKRYLHQLFEELDTTLDQFIWQRRIELCQAHLQSKQGQHKTIAEIAYGSGFTSSAHFCRSFKTHTGVSPREFKAQAFAAA